MNSNCAGDIRTQIMIVEITSEGQESGKEGTERCTNVLKRSANECYVCGKMDAKPHLCAPVLV